MGRARIGLIGDRFTRAKVREPPHIWFMKCQDDVLFRNPHFNQSVSQPLFTLWQLVSEQLVTPEELLALIDRTRVNGDSEAQVRIWEVAVEPLERIETAPWKRGIYQSLVAPAAESASPEAQLSNPEPDSSQLPGESIC